ncbi:FAD-dependent oxidoreductase [Thiopseudomonas alkaliphila]|uniref:FAD-dependent oxidoreductase n=1 Tax=Thiopseudomonas alkaliphila TaxID=1697053 RepID=A0A0K1XCW0_9GAMM|nr:glycerol-3-phosphate dehydrogenase/oxidase [Thiopseudomonas alkaliphila]AKX44538.1 FAD-dependent oxidoreductase [Thiopseudomonas alkaliphila]AKX59028.1 FAD-dependent oxidoreductase [Thiopseudomonas alkaliphila]
MHIAPWNHQWRKQQLSDLLSQQWDLVVVGGGITGAGILLAAAQQGWRCLLVEQQDIAWGTSSRSSKMVHGGLRYLAQGHWRLTRDSAQQRQYLLQAMHGLIEPLPFAYPHYKGEFPGPCIMSATLKVYDTLAGQRQHRQYSHTAADYLAPALKQQQLTAINCFQDAITDDVRLVLRVLQAARALGAEVLTQVQVQAPIYQQQRIVGLQVVDQLSGQAYSLTSQVVAQAAGVWTDLPQSDNYQLRPLRGSHLLLPYWRLPVSQAISFRHPQDQRSVFVFPWAGATIIGTTDLDHQQDLQQEARIEAAECLYLLAAANHLFPEARLTINDVRSTWSGVRPIVTKQRQDQAPSAASREHHIWQEPGRVSVAGGKLTTYRLLAAEVVQHCALQLTRHLKSKSIDQSWQLAIPDWNFPAAIGWQQRQRLLGYYGQGVGDLLALFQQLGTEQLAGLPLYQAELVFACRYEQVLQLDDLLLRRTRIGLLLAEGGRALLPLIKTLCQAELEWSDQQWQQQVKRYLEIWQRYYSLPEELLV